MTAQVAASDAVTPASAIRPPEDREVEELAGRLDAALAAVAELDSPARQVAEELKAALDDVHRAMLVPTIRQLREHESAREVLFELVDDPRVRMVMLMHGLIRPDPLTLANQALDSIRPQLQSHGGDVSLDHISDGTAYVRLSGACNGCSMSAVTMRNGVEEALKAQVPGINAVEVLANEPGPALISLDQIGRPSSAMPQPGWAEAGDLGEFELGELTVKDLTAADGSNAEVIVVNLGGQLASYLNACPHLGNSLDDAEVDPVNNTLTCSWHGFCFDALSGECQTLPGAQLQQLPLRVEHSQVWVRVGA